MDALVELSEKPITTRGEGTEDIPIPKKKPEEDDHGAIQPAGGVIGEHVVVSDTESRIKAWGVGQTIEIAKEQALFAAAAAMIKKQVGDKLNEAISHSGWKGIVWETCSFDKDTSKPSVDGGRFRWESIVICQQKELLDWLIKNKFIEMEIPLPEIVILPSRLIGETENLSLTEDEKYCFTALRKLFRKRDTNYQIDDFETIIRSMKSAGSKQLKDSGLGQSFALAADIILTFDVSVNDSDEGFIQGSCVMSAIFVSTGKSMADAIGKSEEIEKTEVNRLIAIEDAANKAIGNVYDQIMTAWKREVKNGWFYRIIFKSMEDDVKGILFKSLKSTCKMLTQNSYSEGKWDISAYVNVENSDPVSIYYTLNEAIKEKGYKLKVIAEYYHALVYELVKK